MDSSAPDNSITLDEIRKTSISRRGGVRVRGGRLPPIRIRDVAPASNKKVIAPKIPQRRVKIEKENPEPSVTAVSFSKDVRTNFRKPFSRGRGQRVYIQTEGSFLEQGPAMRLKKESVEPRYERISRSSSRIKSEMENKINARQINLLLEGYDDKDAYSDPENDMQPVRLPYIKKECTPKIKEEILDIEDVKPKIKEEVLDNEDIKLKIKKELEDDTDEMKVNLILPEVKTIKQEMPEPKICSLMEAMKLSQEADVFVLFQLPSCLPFKRYDENSDQVAKKVKSSTGQEEKEETSQDEAQGISYKDLPEGSVGKLQIMKSGRMRLVLESVDIEIESAVNEGSMAEVVSIALTNEDEGNFTVLGKIYQKMIMSPILTDCEREIKSEIKSE